MADTAPRPTAALSLTKTERRLLGLVFRRGPTTQGVLADELELTQQSVSRLVAGLMERGMLQPGERVSASRRPSTAIAIAPDHIRTAGVAIMADAVSISISDFAGRPVAERSAHLGSMETDTVMDWVETAIEESLTSLGRSNAKLAGLGISISGSFLGTATGLNTPRSLDAWANVDVASLFSNRFGLPAWADNDGNTAALAECIGGVGRWAPSFAYLYLSAGVGGGIVLDGQLWRGRHGNAGEFAGGLPPNVFPFPNLELLRQLVGRDGTVFDTVHALVDAYDSAWPAIDDWIARVRDSVSIIASNATAILDLEAIVLGGLIPRDLADRLIPRVEFFDQKRRAQLRPTARLVASEIGRNAAAIGAAMLPLRALYLR